MENNGAARRGPRPARTASGRRLSPTRAALLETLQSQPEPTSLPALAATTRLHPNTVREHLDGLRASGLVRREQAPPSGGRGRPAWLYAATPQSHEDPRPEYAGLAAALAAVIVRTSPDPAADARAAGADWGRRLAAETEPPADNGTAARRSVTGIFDTMGFAPEADDEVSEVRLTRCPLLEAAHQQPEVVCSVHLGIAQGALEAYDASTEGLELLPFIEPGACLLRLQAGR